MERSGVTGDFNNLDEEGEDQKKEYILKIDQGAVFCAKCCQLIIPLLM